MFKKRQVPGAEIVQHEFLQHEETLIEPSVDTSVKKTKLTSTSGGVLVKDVKTEAVEREEEQIIVDGEIFEEEIEKKKKSRDAVTVDRQDNTKKSASKFGPSSAPAYVRATTIIDYKPDLCKDYNETGYCGYGDSCIYLHDRTTYVSGNVLDKRWDDMLKESEKKKKEIPKEVPGDKPTCGICKKLLTPPMVKTRCGHTFCKACAFEFEDKKHTCATCGFKTLGIFNEIPL